MNFLVEESWKVSPIVVRKYAGAGDAILAGTL